MLSEYSLMNLVAVFLAAIVAVFLRKRRRILRIIKLSLLAPALSFPWLYFGINQKAWAHGDAGPVFMSVPINELVLAFLMTFVNGGVLLLCHRSILEEARRRTEAKNSSTEKRQDDPISLRRREL